MPGEGKKVRDLEAEEFANVEGYNLKSIEYNKYKNTIGWTRTIL